MHFGMAWEAAVEQRVEVGVGGNEWVGRWAAFREEQGEGRGGGQVQSRSTRVSSQQVVEPVCGAPGYKARRDGAGRT